MPLVPTEVGTGSVYLTELFRRPLLAGLAVLVAWTAFTAVVPNLSVQEGVRHGVLLGGILFVLLALARYAQRRATGR